MIHLAFSGVYAGKKDKILTRFTVRDTGEARKFPIYRLVEKRKSMVVFWLV
jgi:hypothetical protein